MSDYSEGQTHQLMNAFQAANYTSAQLTKLGQSPSLLDELRLVLDEGAKIVRNTVQAVKETATYLRQLFTDLEIGAKDGTETFESSGMFPGGVYGVAVPAAAKGKPTLATKATVWEMILDGIFTLLFGSLGENRKRWTEAQVIEFCRRHRGKLRTGGYATFFEMEGGVVASVRFVDDGRLEVDVYEFSDDDVWDAEYRRRLVSLQQ